MNMQPFLISVCLFCLSLASAAQEVRLKAGDVTVIEILRPLEDAPNVTSCYTVRATGNLKMPYLDHEVRAAGLTFEELKEALERNYHAAGIYDGPVFRVQMGFMGCACAPVVAVGGEVRCPQGSVPMREGMHLYQAIMAVGGLTEFADVGHVRIIRGRTEMMCDLRDTVSGASTNLPRTSELNYDPGMKGFDPSNNPILEDGDAIHVPSNDYGSFPAPARNRPNQEYKLRAANGNPSGKLPPHQKAGDTVQSNAVNQEVPPNDVRTLLLPSNAAAHPAAALLSELGWFSAVTIHDTAQGTSACVPLGMDTGLIEAIVSAGYGPAVETSRHIILTRHGQDTRYTLQDIKPGGSINPLLESVDLIVVGSSD